MLRRLLAARRAAGSLRCSSSAAAPPRARARRALSPFVDTAQVKVGAPTHGSALINNPVYLLSVLAAFCGLLLIDHIRWGLRAAAGRVLNVTGEAMVVALYYQWIDLWEQDPFAKVVERCRCHEIAAFRWLDLALAWGGVYVKMGQMASAMTQYLPLEWCLIMKPCLEHANRMPPMQVEEVFMQHGGLGGSPAELFDDFDYTAEKAASLAEVHWAKQKGTGCPVAVKVQYFNVPTMMIIDMKVLGVFSKLMEWGVGADMSWLHKYFSKSMAEETDFVQEGKNCDRFREMFADWEDVSSPRVMWETSSERILTMEYIDGFNVDDRAAMDARGIDRAEVSKRMAEVVASSIFDHGFLHADPHPANVFVAPAEGTGRVFACEPLTLGKMLGSAPPPEAEKAPTPEVDTLPPPPPCAKWTLQWLDHGLYVTLPDAIRTEYAKLWAAIGTQDVAGVEAACQGMGVSNWKLLGRILGGAGPVALEGTSAASAALSRDDFFVPHTAETNMALGLLEVLGELPPEVILLLKCNALLRSVQKELGVDVTYGKVMARGAVNYLTAQDLRAAATPAQRRGILAAQKRQLHAINAV